MIKSKHIFSGVLILFFSFLSAQNQDKKVLFTIDEKPYYTDEFKRVYQKNLDLVKDESQKDLDKYLELFIGYKLKINKAYKLKLNEDSNYLNELKTYRTQLAKNYLTDTKVTQELIDEAYKRALKEINASHILVMVNENAAPADTLIAYNKIKEARERILKGEEFSKVAQAVSEDPSVKENNGELGFFTAFRMVYPFESAAYNTQKGQLSKIFRTRYGYHFLKVNDIRDNRGEITVAHIMVMNPQNDDEAEKQKAKSTIDDIYKKIQQGEDFAELAKQFSQDKASAPKGGQLNRFGSGQLSSPEFENAAFNLTKENPISAPFQSQFGWHIVKLIDKHPIKSFDEMKKELETKIERDERSKKIANSLTEKLKAKYKPKRNEKLYASIVKTVNDDVYKNEWKKPENVKPFEGDLLSFTDKNINGSAFIDFIHLQQKSIDQTKPVAKWVDKIYTTFLEQQLNQHYSDNLENEFSDFAAVMNEYRDGLLLFELMEKEIWEKSKTDTLGLQKFYETIKDKYQWKTRYNVNIASTTKEDIAKKALKMLKKKTSFEDIKKALNTGETVNIMFTEGVYEEDNTALPKSMPKKIGLSEIYKEGNYFYITNISKITPAGAKTLDEARGRFINDYQQFLEENWISNLKQEFTIKINQEVFNQVKNEMKN